jgi:hypothetical protein
MCGNVLEVLDSTYVLRYRVKSIESRPERMDEPRNARELRVARFLMVKSLAATA